MLSSWNILTYNIHFLLNFLWHQMKWSNETNFNWNTIGGFFLWYVFCMLEFKHMCLLRLLLSHGTHFPNASNAILVLFETEIYFYPGSMKLMPLLYGLSLSYIVSQTISKVRNVLLLFIRKRIVTGEQLFTIRKFYYYIIPDVSPPPCSVSSLKQCLLLQCPP